MKTINKNKAFYLTFIFFLLLFIFLIFNAFKMLNKQIIGNINNFPYTIIIDSGHGGEDGGAVNKDGIAEKDINLAIAKKLEKMLYVSGLKIQMTRTSDISIHDKDANTIRKKKVSDLNNRLKIFNSSSKNIVISIHQNNFSEEKYCGTQIFYSNNEPKSKEIAECIRKSVVNLLQPNNSRECKPAGKNIFILHNANVPAVIVECGFLSNKKESSLLSSEDYQKKMAFAIYCGILDYIKNN